MSDGIALPLPPPPMQAGGFAARSSTQSAPAYVASPSCDCRCAVASHELGARTGCTHGPVRDGRPRSSSDSSVRRQHRTRSARLGVAHMTAQAGAA